MTPLNDPRPFADVLRDWMTRHNLTAYAAGPRLGTSKVTVGKWLSGGACNHAMAYRALMSVIDEGAA